MEIADKVLEIERECFDRRISPKEAINEIDRTIGGITRVEYKEGRKFIIDNHDKRIKLQYKGLSKRQLKLVCALAILAYARAQHNGYSFPGELHISRYASTNHHTGGIGEISKYS